MYIDINIIYIFASTNKTKIIMKTIANFKTKELVHYQGIVLCDNDNLPKVYSGAKKANEAAGKLGAKIQQIKPTKQQYYVVK